MGDIPQADKDKIIPAIAADLPAMVAADRAFQNAVIHSDLQNAKIEHQVVLQDAVTSLVTTNTELFREFNDNPAFRDWLTEVNFTDAYEQVSKTLPADPSDAPSAAPQPAEVPHAVSDTADYSQTAFASGADLKVSDVPAKGETPPGSDPADVLAVVPDSQAGPEYGPPLAEMGADQRPEPVPQEPGVPSIPKTQTGSDIIAAPDIIQPVDGSASVQDVPPPQIPEISTNDNVRSLRQKWLRGDRNLDQYAAAFGIKNIPNDAAQLFLKADGSLGVRRLGTPPQPPVSVETPKRKSGAAGGTGGGGSSATAPTQMTHVPAMSTLTDWNQLSIEEKLHVITTINQALAERSRLALGLMLMTCDDTGGLDVLKKGERIGKIPSSNVPCVPAPVVATRGMNGASSGKQAAAHVWHSRRETRAAAGRR